MIRLLVALVASVLSLAAAELTLRVAGRQPWRTSVRFAREPTMVVPDAELGWRNKPGSYLVPPYSALGEPVPITILANGARDSGSVGGDGAEILFLGGSVTFGWALADTQTLGWRVQQALPHRRVTNLAAPAYGTLQSLMVMERVFAQPNPPQRVLYGFIPHHLHRNVADADWLRVLSQHATRQTVAIPFADLGARGQLERHAPLRYPAWRFHETFATVAFAERLYADWSARSRRRQATEVTGRLLLEMDALAKRHGARFSVVLFWSVGGAASAFDTLLDGRDIDVVDCVRPMTQADLIPGEGHPSGSMNATWAECLVAHLRAEIS